MYWRSCKSWSICLENTISNTDHTISIDEEKKSLRIFGKGRWWHRPLAHPTHCPGQKPKPNPIDSRVKKGVHTQHCLICDVVSVLFHFANTYHQQKGVKGVANLWGIFWARPAKTNMTFHLPRSSFSTASPSSWYPYSSNLRMFLQGPQNYFHICDK